MYCGIYEGLLKCVSVLKPFKFPFVWTTFNPICFTPIFEE